MSSDRLSLLLGAFLHGMGDRRMVLKKFLPSALCGETPIPLSPFVDINDDKISITNAVVSNLLSSNVEMCGADWQLVLLSVQRVADDNQRTLTKLARLSLMLAVSASDEEELLLTITTDCVTIVSRFDGYVDVPHEVQIFLESDYVVDKFQSFLPGDVPTPKMIVCDGFEDDTFRGFACLSGSFAVYGELFDEFPLSFLSKLDFMTLSAHEQKHVQLRLCNDNFLVKTPDLLNTPRAESGYLLEQRIWDLVPRFFHPRNPSNAEMLAQEIVQNLLLTRNLEITPELRTRLRREVGTRPVQFGVAADMKTIFVFE